MKFDYVMEKVLAGVASIFIACLIMWRGYIPGALRIELGDNTIIYGALFLIIGVILVVIGMRDNE